MRLIGVTLAEPERRCVYVNPAHVVFVGEPDYECQHNRSGGGPPTLIILCDGTKLHVDGEVAKEFNLHLEHWFK